MQLRLRALACLPLLLALTAPAGAQGADFEHWSAAWSPGFADDFEDGVLSPFYQVACGAAVETDGRLVLTTATSPCTGFEVRPQALSAGALVMRAIVSLPTIGGGPTPGRVPPTSQGRVGIATRNAAGTDAVFLHVRRSNDERQCQFDPECGPTVQSEFGTGGNDVIYLELADENDRTVSRSFTRTVNPSATEPTLAPGYELELTLAPTGSGLLPSARFRECTLAYLSGGPCATGPFLDLLPVAGPPATTSPDAGLLAAADAHVVAFYARAPGGPFTMRIDDWELALAAEDDFETPPLGTNAPYQTSTQVCGSATVGGGALALDAAGGCPKVIAAFAGSLASEASAAATLRWTLPARCEQRGVALTAGGDQANLALVRDADGSLALWLTSEPESGDGPAIPLLARTLLSAAPAGDPALADVAAVELRLAVTEDELGALAPHGEYRLCETSPCASQVAFTALDPAGFDPPETGVACGVDLAERAAPSDGGVLAPGSALAASLYVVPEPVAFGSALAAVLALGALRRRGSAVR